MHVFLDLDGVLVDFFGAALRTHGRPELIDSYPAEQYEIHEVLSISKTQFWKPMSDAVWWTDLAPYPWFDELLAIVRRMPRSGGFSVATSPSHAPGSAAGKVQWMQKHFGREFRDYMIGPQKHRLAQPGAVLIDDNDENIAKFTESGGQAILFPQPWNAMHGEHRTAEEKMRYVEGRLAAIVEEAWNRV